MQWSRGTPWISSAVRTRLVLSSGIMAGTAKRSSSDNSSLEEEEGERERERERERESN